MALKTRKPTGAVPWPLVLIEGAEKAGKSYACAQFSASERVGQTYWIDIGEGAADEYGAIPGSRYLVVEHDGSFDQILAAVADIKKEARRAADADEPPVVLVIDSMTAEWDLLKEWAGNRAKTSKSNRAKLERDPNAEVNVPMNIWNDANARHRKLMTHLLTFPGIVLVTARGKEVASLDDNGKPVEGVKEYKVEGHKTLAYDASVWVRLSRDEAPVVVGARSVHHGVRPGVDKPRPVKDFSLEWLVFDLLRCDPSGAHVRDLPSEELKAAKNKAWNARPAGWDMQTFGEDFSRRYSKTLEQGTAEDFNRYADELVALKEAEAKRLAEEELNAKEAA